MNPSDFTAIKSKIESSNVLSATEKKEWLFLLPRMSGEEIKELDRILSIRLPGMSSPPGVPVTPSPARGEGNGVENFSPRHHFWTDIWKRKESKPNAGSGTPASPARGSNIEVKSKTEIPKPQHSTFHIPHTIRRPDVLPKTAPIEELNRLTSLTLEDLRGSASVYSFLENVNEKIKDMLLKHIPAHEIISAYEKSPFHKAYLNAGIKLLGRARKADLTREEFEAITDFRTSLMKLTN